MDYKKILEELTRKNIEKVERFKSLPKEKRELVEGKIEEITKKVKERLDENKIRITSISSHFREEKLLKDGVTRKDILISYIKEPIMHKTFFVVSDVDTLEMLYVQTDVRRFMEIDEFFTPRDDESEDLEEDD